MNAKKENILEILEEELDCTACPLEDKCAGVSYCKEELARYLFNEGLESPASEEQDKGKETKKDKENPFDFLDSLMKDIESIPVIPIPMEDGHPVIVHIGEMEVIGFAKDVVEFVKQAGDKFAP